MNAYFEAKDKSFHKKGIEMLEKRWTDCVAFEGGYVDEKSRVVPKQCFFPSNPGTYWSTCYEWFKRWLVKKHGIFNTNHLQSDRIQFGKAQKTHHQEKCACKSLMCACQNSWGSTSIQSARQLVAPPRQCSGSQVHRRAQFSGIKIGPSPWSSCVLTRFVTVWLFFVPWTRNAVKRIQIWYDFGDPEGFDGGIEDHHKGGESSLFSKAVWSF